MIKVTLGNGEIKEFDAPLSAFDAARELGEAKTACAAEIDGKVCDLRTTLTDGCTVKFLTFEDEQGQRAFNHTASHVLAQAVKRLFPATKLAIGPAIENGFYYDVDLGDTKLTDEDLAAIEKEMKKIAKSGKKIIRKELDGLKVLGNGELTKKLTVKAAKYTASAKEKIEAVGGTAEVI